MNNSSPIASGRKLHFALGGGQWGDSLVSASAVGPEVILSVSAACASAEIPIQPQLLSYLAVGGAVFITGIAQFPSAPFAVWGIGRQIGESSGRLAMVVILDGQKASNGHQSVHIVCSGTPWLFCWSSMFSGSFCSFIHWGIGNQNSPWKPGF